MGAIASQRIHQSSASLAFVRGIHRGPVNSPHKWPVTRKMSPFNDVIMLNRCTSRLPIHHCLMMRNPSSLLILYPKFYDGPRESLLIPMRNTNTPTTSPPHTPLTKNKDTPETFTYRWVSAKKTCVSNGVTLHCINPSICMHPNKYWCVYFENISLNLGKCRYFALIHYHTAISQNATHATKD